MAKSKITVNTGKSSRVKLGASASSKPPSPLMPKKDYSKKPKQEELVSNANFGQTGLTGET